ncbi:MAG: histidine phosphatase family protein [Hyphomonadaceae bacterium]
MIYLVRHGEAAASWGEHPDPGLSTKGQLQSERAAERLSDLGADNLICSPMRRCRETAAPFARKLGRAAAINQAVSEIVTPEGIEDRVAWLRDLMSGQWPDAMIDWRRGAYDAVCDLPDGTAIFSHFVAINAIVGMAQKDNTVLIFKPDHCSITRLEHDGNGGLCVAELGGDAVTKIL